MSELTVCKLDGVQHIVWFDYWYRLAGDYIRQLRVNVIGYTLLAQRLHIGTNFEKTGIFANSYTI